MSTELGKVAYDGYFKSAGGRSLVSGTLLPVWDQLTEPIQQAWDAAAIAICEFVGVKPPAFWELFQRSECPFHYCETKAPHTECKDRCRRATT